MTSWPVLLAVYEFIDWAQLLVIFMAIYYFIMFAIFQTDEDKKEDEERAKNFNKWLESEPWKKKEKKKEEIKKAKESKREKAQEKKEASQTRADERKAKSDARKEAKVSKDKKKKLDEHKTHVTKMANNLLRTIAEVEGAISELPDKKEAKSKIDYAERFMERAFMDHEALKDMAEDTPHLDQANYLRGEITKLREELHNIDLDETELRNFNGKLGLVVTHIKEIAEKIYGHLELIKQVGEKSKKKGKPTGATRVGRVATTR